MQQSDRQEYTVDVCLLSDVGCCREANQDQIKYVKPADPPVLKDKGVLAIVADGMGGHRGGEFASQMAVDIIHQRYYVQAQQDPPKSLKEAFMEANTSIYQRSVETPALSGMGTTATALVVLSNRMYLAHVGDSRLYRLRDGKLECLTEDHTMVMEMLKRGLITPEQARHHPDRYIVTRALGTHPDVEVFSPEVAIPIQNDDYYVLCTDGLHDLVADEEITSTVTMRSPQDGCGELTALAKKRGGPDNISVGILAIRAVEKPSRPARDTWA